MKSFYLSEGGIFIRELNVKYFEKYIFIENSKRCHE